jgi:hypothetical protein
VDDRTYTNGDGLDLTGNKFSIKPSYQLPQTCNDLNHGSPQYPVWNGSTWVCGSAAGFVGDSGRYSTSWDSADAHDFGLWTVNAGNEPGPLKVAFVIARVTLHASDDATLTCRLADATSANYDVDETTTALEGDSTIGTNANSQTTVLMGLVGAGTQVFISCDSPGGHQDATVSYFALPAGDFG